MFLWLVERLSGEEFGRVERFKARTWILKGDWRFKKGDVRLEYADFWPTTDQLSDILAAHDMVVMTRGDMRSMLDRRYQEGQRAGHSKAWRDRLPDNEQTVKFNTEVAQELLAAKVEILDLKEKLAKCQQQIERTRHGEHH